MSRVNVTPAQVKVAMKLLKSNLKWKNIEKIVGVEWNYLLLAIKRENPNFQTNKRRGRPFVKKQEFSSDEEKKHCIDDYLYRRVGVERLAKKYGFGEKRLEALLYREGVLKGAGRKYWNHQGTILRDELNLKVVPSERKTREMKDARRKESRKSGGPLEF